MAKLICTASTSLDGYVADADGNFDWTAPDPQVHSFINDLERPNGTYLYGRRVYEVMRVWEDMEIEGQPPYIQDYARIWRAADKVVYSRTLGSVPTARTRLEAELDIEAVRRLVAESPSDVSIGGATLAAHAIRAGLVDEFRIFLVPVIVGGGTRLLPDGARAQLELLETKTFNSGTVYLRCGRL